MSYTFKTILYLKPDEVKLMRQICEDVQVKDDTFDFEIHELEDSDELALIVKSSDRKQAHRRGIWLRKRIGEHFGRSTFYDIKR